MMAHKPNTIDNIMTKFNVKTLPTIKVDTKYKGIKKMVQLLYSNAATLPIPQGRGRHGKIGIIMKTTLYITLTTLAWTNLPDLGVYYTITTNFTVAL